MIGIYKIQNLKNNKIYIGQSKNIERRWKEHKYTRDHLPLHLAFQKYGIENFSFTIIEKCSIEELNNKERYWIKYYSSNNKNFGYNISSGGQENFHLSGEKHSQSKLNENEVQKIKSMLKSNYSVQEIYSKYSSKICKSSISNINQGKTWKDDKEIYPLSKQTTSLIGTKNGMAKINEEIVLQIRHDYINMSFKEIISKYSQYSYSTLRSVVYGESWKHLPIYKKKQKKWIEPCIDYSQSLKQAGK